MIHQQYKFTAFGDCPIDCAINIIVEYTEDFLHFAFQIHMKRLKLTFK